MQVRPSRRDTQFRHQWNVNIPMLYAWVPVSVEERVLSIAIPALGAGNGGLNWSDVKAKIEKALGDLTDVDVVVFEPTVQSTQAF
jgi:O-acetyl-ADP-ribose deacetylase (regulator of RNase III)